MDVLEEVTDYEPRIDKAHVEARVRDWEDRIEGLYAGILGWLPGSWNGTVEGTVSFHEELMVKFGLGQRRLPVLKLRSRSSEALLEPRGLWIIGANGRVDMTRADDRRLLTDRAPIFEPPRWFVAPFMDRLHRRPLDRDTLHAFLE